MWQTGEEGCEQTRAFSLGKVRRLVKRAKTQAQLDHATDLRLRKAYGITLADYNARLAEHGGRCEICRKPPVKVRLSVDHDHAWKKVKHTAVKFEEMWVAEAFYRGRRHTSSAFKRSVAVKGLKHLLLQSSVRGLLCIHCNRGLRFYADLPERMRSGAAYLERHQKEGTDANTKS